MSNWRNFVTVTPFRPYPWRWSKEVIRSWICLLAVRRPRSIMTTKFARRKREEGGGGTIGAKFFACPSSSFAIQIWRHVGVNKYDVFWSIPPCPELENFIVMPLAAALYVSPSWNLGRRNTKSLTFEWDIKFCLPKFQEGEAYKGRTSGADPKVA